MESLDVAESFHVPVQHDGRRFYVEVVGLGDEDEVGSRAASLDELTGSLRGLAASVAGAVEEGVRQLRTPGISRCSPTSWPRSPAGGTACS